jgi:hypothetical protein
MKFNESFRSKCFELLKNIERRKPIKGKDEAYTYMIEKEERIIFSDNYNLIIHKLVDEILNYKQEIEENYSHGFIRDKISNFIIDLYYNNEKEKSCLIDNFFKNFKNELLYSPKEFVVPELIENLSFDFDFEIDKVKFVQYSQENYRKIFYENRRKHASAFKKANKGKMKDFLYFMFSQYRKNFEEFHTKYIECI